MDSFASEIVIRRDGVVLQRRRLSPGVYLIGRGEEADLRLDDAAVSRRHARLTVEASVVFIEDLGSRGGTIMAGRPVVGSAPLPPEEPVLMGDHSIEWLALPGGGVGDSAAPPEPKARYELGPIVAQGGMGAIHTARDLSIQRRVAMKVMLEASADVDQSRFLCEAQITGQLEHPNIVPVHELGFDASGAPFYTMKFVRGRTLKDVIADLANGTPEARARFPLATLLTVFQKVCDAVAFAHSRRVIHRDLKPENIMLGDFGEVLVMDWGLAKVIGGGSDRETVVRDRSVAPTEDDPLQTNHLASRTRDGVVMGTPHYMAPEQAMGEIALLDARSDLYSLGAILYEILALRSPVSGGTVGEVLRKVCAGELTPLPERSAHLPGGRVPDSLRAVCRQALALSPERRYQTVTDLQRDLTAYQQGFATAAENAGLFTQFALALRRHRKEAAILAVSVVLLLTVAVTAFVHINRERSRAEKTLAELRKTAPTFQEQAQSLWDAGNYDGALAKIGYAIELDPRHPDYLLRRAHMLQGLSRLPEAAAAYEAALAIAPAHPAAVENLRLCRDLLAANGSGAELRLDLQERLVAAILTQGRRAEAAPLALRLRKNATTIEPILRARLAEYRSQAGWNDGRLQIIANGTFSLSLANLKLGDLTKLKDLMITEFHFNGTGLTALPDLTGFTLSKIVFQGNLISDLSPLRGQHLRYFQAVGNPVFDLSPLQGQPIDTMIIAGTKVADLSPLKGMPLQMLDIQSTPVLDLSPLAGSTVRELLVNRTAITDFSPLHETKLEKIEFSANQIHDLTPFAGVPLRELDLREQPNIRDFLPLLECRHLRVLTIPANANIDGLREHPSLEAIAISVPTPGNPRTLDGPLPVKTFWQKYGALMSSRQKAQNDGSPK